MNKTDLCVMSYVKMTFFLCPLLAVVCHFQCVFLRLSGTDLQAVRISWLFKNINLLKVVVKIHD